MPRAWHVHGPVAFGTSVEPVVAIPRREADHRGTAREAVGRGEVRRSWVGCGCAGPAPSAGKSGRQQCRAMGGTGTCRSSPEDGHTTPEQHACTTAAGVDRGVTVAVACSDGTMRDRQFSTPGEARRYLVLQKKLARQKKGSTNRKKTVAALRQVKRRERDRRQDFVSWTANRLATRHGMVAVEDLKTRNMTRSAKGTVKEPGSRVAQKAGLNRSILGKGWHKLQLARENVARCTGTTIVKVPAAYTSQRCSACRTVDPESRESQAVFRCTTCGYEENADVNAAKNVLADGLSVSACGDLGATRSMKQEPGGNPRGTTTPTAT